MLFSDIEGSTQLLQRLGSRWSEALVLHRSVLRAAFTEHSGHEMGTEGDSFFVVFPTAAQALHAAVTGQRHLREQSWPDGVSLRVRMGLHTGEPQQIDGGYVGIEVHRAARIASTAHGGQIVVSAATAALGGAALTALGVSLRDLGWHRLKDFSGDARLADVDLGETFPPLRSLGTRSRLPVPLTSMIGREQELARLLDLMAQSDVRLVTLTGSGGSGKTRLALGAAHALEREASHGVFFVGMHAVRTAPGAWAAIADAVDAPGTADARARVLEHVAGRELLLLLDNLEQVQEADEVVAALLSAGPGIGILATTRRSLRLVGEHEWPVPPLELPAQVALSGDSVESAGASSAVQLFVRQARMIGRGFALNEANVADVVALCRRLDGLPLALELAAARTRLFPPRVLLSRLDDRLGSDVTAGDRPDRHRTLGATIAWSHDLLGPQEQRAFARLGVFAASADLPAVEAVLSEEGPEAADPLDLVAALVDANLLLIVDTGDGEPRVTMFATIRAHAHQRLEASAEHDQVRLRHARWLQQTTATLSEQLNTSGHIAARDAYTRLDDDVRAALDWCLQPVGGVEVPSDTAVERLEIGLALMTAMTQYWYRFGHLVEGRRWTQRSLAVAGERDSTETLQATHTLGVMTLQMRDTDAALEVFQRALAMAERLKNPSFLSREMTSLAIAWREAGDPARSKDLLEVSIELARSIPDPRRESTALSNLVASLCDLGEHEEAARVGHLAVITSDSLGDVWAASIDRINLGTALLRAEGPPAAYAQVRAAADEALASGDVELGIVVAEVLAAVLAELDEVVVAGRLLGCADLLRERSGLPRSAPDDAQLSLSLSSAKSHPSWEGAYAEGQQLELEAVVQQATRIPVTSST